MEDTEEDRHQGAQGGLSVPQRGGDLPALSGLNAYCNYEDVMDVSLETTGEHSLGSFLPCVAVHWKRI